MSITRRRTCSAIALPKLLLRPANLSLRRVLTVPFVLLTFGTTALIGYLSYRSGQETAKSLRDQVVTQTSAHVEQELRSYVKTPLLINRLNVDAIDQGQLDPQNTPALEAALFNRSQQFDQVTAILFASSEGRLRVVERLPEGRYSVESDPPRPEKLRIYPLDDAGNRKQLIPGKHNLDVRDRVWYKRAVTERNLGWSPISQYGSCRALALTASQPVYDRTTRQLLGVSAVHFRLDYLSQFLNQLETSRVGQVIITDQSGALVATSTEEQPYTAAGKAECSQLKQLKIDQSQNPLTRSLGEYLRDRPIPQSQLLELQLNGEPHYVKMTLFRDPYGLDWRVLTVIPKSHFMGAIEQNAATTVSLSLLALGIAIMLGAFAAKKFGDRFAQFNQASQALAAGRLDQRLPTHSIAELNSLSQTFNQMADQLQSAFDQLKTNLAESEEKFAVIFHSSPDPIVLVSVPEGRCVEANESFLNLLNYSQEALIGQVFLDLGVWVNLEERDHLIQALNQQGFVRNLEVRFLTRTQQIKTVLLSAELIEISDTTYSLSIIRDISDRKAIEAALQESEARFRQLAETVEEGFFVYETGTNRYSYVNPAYSTIKGESSNVIYEGMHRWLDHIHPADLERIKAALEREQQGETFDEEYRYIRPDGELRWLRSKAFPIQNEAGTVIRVVGTFDDITDVKQRQAEREAAEQALQQAEERYSLATRAAKVGVWEWNVQTNEVYLDPNIKALIGYTDAEIRNDTEDWLSLVHPDDRSGVIEAAQDYLAGKAPDYEVEYRMLHKDGSIVWILLRGQLIRDEQGNPERLIGTDTDITDLKRAQKALRQSEHRFQQLASASPSLIYTIVESPTAPMRFEYLSPAFEPIHEVPVAVALQNAEIVFEIMHPDDREGYRQAVERSIATLQPFRHEWRILTPFGKLKWLQANSQPQRRGDELVWHGVVQEVTQRKQAEAEIQQLNQQLTDRVNELQTLFNVLPIGVAISEDSECKIARVNPRLAELLRVPIDANASPSAPNVERPAYKVYRNGQEVSNENLPMQYAAAHDVEVKDEVVNIVHPDGTMIRLLSYASPLRDEQGKVRGVIGGFVDITEREQIKEALRTSEERFRRAFDDAPIGISLVSPTGQFLRANPIYCDLVGYTEAELMALSFQALTHADDLDQDMKGFRELLNGETRSFKMEKRYLTKQGTVVPVVLNAAPIRDPSGRVLYVVGHIQDIRDRLKVEQMKDQFISVVSHELRTPLTSIRGSLGILESGVFQERPEKAQQMLQIAVSNSDRLARLVNDILTLERLGSGKAPLMMELCQIPNLIQQAVNSVQMLADQSGIKLCVTPLSGKLWAAPDAIVQTLTNLLSNAIKFSTAGDTVWLSAEAISSEACRVSEQPCMREHQVNFLTPYILFTVKDQGRGIPQNKLDVIFEQFQQVDVSDSRKKGGTGLGLAICKQIAQQHHGRIWVESSLGKGSTFYFALPSIIKAENS